MPHEPENHEENPKTGKLQNALALEIEKVIKAATPESPVDKLLDDLERRGILDHGLPEAEVRKIISEIQSVHVRNLKHLEYIDSLLDKLN